MSLSGISNEDSLLLLRTAAELSFNSILVTGLDRHIVYANPAFCNMTGYTPTEVIGHKPSLLKSGKHDKTFYKNLWRHLNEGLPFRAMVINRHKNGHEIHCQQTITPVKNSNGTVSHFISIIKDMTDRVFEELKLREQASHDALTGLLNRRAGEIELEIALFQAHAKEAPFCMLMLDIDDFKIVNDTYGHLRGDEIIKAVANILMDHTRKTDKCIRWGGEEFIVILPFCDLPKATDIAENIRAAMAASHFDEAGQVTLSIGAAESLAADTPIRLLERVDRRLYSAKGAGKNRVATE